MAQRTSAVITSYLSSSGGAKLFPFAPPSSWANQCCSWFISCSVHQDVLTYGPLTKMPAQCPKLSGPVRSLTPDPDTLVLECDRGFRWPLVFGIGGAALLLLGFLLPELISLFFGVLSILAAFSFVVTRPWIVVSAKARSLQQIRRAWVPWERRRTLLLSFDDIREFILQAEFVLGVTHAKPFVWHLLVADNEGQRLPLTWHFFREPVLQAGQEAARITGKPLLEEPDPLQSSRWQNWWYNLMR